MAQRSAIDQLFTCCAAAHAPRRHPPTTLHPLATILTTPILATMCGVPHGGEIEHWGQAKAEWLAAFLALAAGIPSHGMCGRVLAVLDPASLQQAFVAWIKALADLPQDLVARDGNTLRRSRDRADGKGPVHVVKAWASANEGGLAQGKVDATTTELTALPALLRLRTLTGAVVTVDALGCQGEIARQMQAQGADSVLSFQGNQPSVYRDGVDRFAWRREPRPLE